MDAAEYVAATDHDADLDMQIVDLSDLVSDSLGGIHTDTEILLP
jgi:hypothetical protein